MVLDQTRLTRFAEFVRLLIALDRENEGAPDDEKLLRQLYNAVTPDEFEKFLGIVNSAADL